MELLSAVRSTLKERGYLSGQHARVATLHVVIEEWDRLDGETHVHVSGRLFDDRRGVLIWTRVAEDFEDSRGTREKQGSWRETAVDSPLDSVIDTLACGVERAGAGAEVTERMLHSLPRTRSRHRGEAGP